MVEVEAERLRLSAELAPYVEDVGVNIVVRSEPGYELRTDVLDAPKFGVTLKNVRMLQVQQPDGGLVYITEATVFVKHGKLAYLTQRVADYADPAKNTVAGNEKNREFVANITFIGLAAIEAFWTSLYPLPDLDLLTWWEVWVRSGGSEAKREVIHVAVRSEAQAQGLTFARRATQIAGTHCLSPTRYPPETCDGNWSSQLRIRVTPPCCYSRLFY